MRDGLAAGDRVQLHINNGRNKAYIRNGLDWIKRFPRGSVGRFLSRPGEVCFWHI
jgi:ATP-dependent DNA ligase